MDGMCEMQEELPILVVILFDSVGNSTRSRVHPDSASGSQRTHERTDSDLHD